MSLKFQLDGSIFKTEKLMDKNRIYTDDGTQWTKVITAKKRLLDLHLRDVWDYRYLIKMFIKR
ncbi:MAG: hypothetical protein VZR56_13170, partial [Treponema sp.]|nr:hypothetical protein [Treponema sp.]